MISSWIRTPTLAGLGIGLAATLLLSVAGCGGKGPDSGEAIVVTEPNANVPKVGNLETVPSSSPGATTPGATSPAAPSTPSATTKAEGWGTLKGKVTLKGSAPKPKEIVEKGKAAKNPEVCAKDTPIVSERMIVDDGSKGIKNVLVYIPKPTAVNEEAKSQAMSAQIVFDQQKCVFDPHVMAVMVGAKVDMKNSDPFNHNVNSRLKNNQFNPVLAPNQDLPLPVGAAERSPGEIICDIHPWMKAYWMVLENPYFAVTDAQGNFEIKNVPAGTQKMVVWQEAVAPNGFVSATSGDAVDIKANDTTTKDFTIDAGKLRPE